MNEVVMHPGLILRDALEARGFSQLEAAQLCGVSPQFLNDVVQGRRGISVRMAMRLEEHLGGNALDWLTRQMVHDLDRARRNQ